MRKLALASTLVAAVALSSGRARAEEPVPQPPPAADGHHTVAPWVVAGIGATVAAVGVLSFIGSVKAHADARDEAAAKGCTTSPDVVCPAGVDATNLKTNVDGEHAMNVIGAVMVGAGGAALLTGLVWHFVEPSARPKSAFLIQPVVAPNLGKLTLTVSF
jgi:hypothetical protein